MLSGCNSVNKGLEDELCIDRGLWNGEVERIWSKNYERRKRSKIILDFS